MEPKVAVYLNGVYRSVLEEIILSKSFGGPETYYLQPHSSRILRQLAVLMPDQDNRIKILMSTTDDYSRIYYQAEIVRWEDKTLISNSRVSFLNQHIEEFQKNEIRVFRTFNEKPCPNLISIQNLERLTAPYHVSFLTKISDSQPLKERTRAGGASYVYMPKKNLGQRSTETSIETLNSNFEQKMRLSQSLSDEKLRARLKSAKRKPERLIVRSKEYVRNPDVIIWALRQANGICGSCKKKAPFKRSSDGTPFLEVHHLVPLAEGGEDTIENVIALCPNCHRKAHFG